MNVPFGTAPTRVAVLPPGAQRDLKDPFADRRSPWRARWVLLLLAALAFAWYLGKLDPLLPTRVRSTSVLGIHAPAYVRPTAPVPVTPVPVPASNSNPSSSKERDGSQPLRRLG